MPICSRSTWASKRGLAQLAVDQIEADPDQLDSSSRTRSSSCSRRDGRDGIRDIRVSILRYLEQSGQPRQRMEHCNCFGMELLPYDDLAIEAFDLKSATHDEDTEDNQGRE